ncbi:MAG: formate--tetrahydrofolate ligase [Gammaproteobacteria bacterium]|nr:MAG: formate--tetrahydrofolate ligase [Gammaproteobacteria bacterium]
MTTDFEIAHAAKLKPIAEVAADLGIPEHAISLYGRHSAKIGLDFVRSESQRRDGKLILVTAITPTASGEGKTVVTIGLGDGLNRLGKKAVVCLREPSLGPCFGIKGGATGGGHAQVVPREQINLHFTGDFHAISAANNLLAALVDNHIYRGDSPVLDPRRISWRRTVDISDRALRQITISQGGKANGLPREDGFDIVPASEVMSSFCLASDLADLEQRLARLIVGWTSDRQPVMARDLQASGAMSALLRDALAPNLVQTLENNPALVHGGAFANIAHGCNSIIATQTALALGDYVVEEAGFGADLGAEKFFNIKCRQVGLVPAATVIVVTLSTLKAHGGATESDLAKENPDAVARGIPNLLRHIEIVKTFGVPFVVAINRYVTDTDAEIATVQRAVRELGAAAIVSNQWSEGGRGAEALAEQVVDLAEGAEAGFKLLYPDDMPLLEKAETIATRIYGADGLTMDEDVRSQFRRLDEEGYGHLPICMAKTQLSLTADPLRKGVPTGFTVPIRELRLAAGAGFVVALTGDILTMPGLPRHPAAHHIRLNERGEIEGIP